LFVRANDIDIYYEQIGTGRPLIILHGNGEDHSRLAGLASSLGKQYAVYSLDSRCHGQSTKTATLSYHDMAEDVAAFIQELSLEKPVLLGASDGGIVGLLLAISYPETLTGLIACGVNTHPSQLSLWFRLYSRLAHFVTHDPKWALMLNEPDIQTADLARIQIPVLVLAGSRDIVKTETTLKIAADITRSEVKILPGQTHDSYLKHHERALNVIQPFLFRLD
jgi:pimeloyl-ACP methyl ester carboxylesterase